MGRRQMREDSIAFQAQLLNLTLVQQLQVKQMLQEQVQKLQAMSMRGSGRGEKQASAAGGSLWHLFSQAVGAPEDESSGTTSGSQKKTAAPLGNTDTNVRGAPIR